jgi:hypothetical protein
MDNILTLNQSIFGTRTKKRRISRRALKASAKELYIPQESEEISYDEGYDIDGGMEASVYFTNQQVWNACSAIYGSYQVLNQALMGGSTTVIGVLAGGIKHLSLLAKIGAIPGIGWVAAGVVTVAATYVGYKLVNCLITGKGLEISFAWTPKWYNPFKGFDFSMACK